jgi:two-component system, LytTR family, response regulator AlgR
MTLTALIVDDEALARSRLRALLADCTAPAVEVLGEAADAAQAMALLQTLEVDVALLDIHMPGADGLALAGAIKSRPKPPAVVFVTAHAEHALSAFELEAVDYLTKPVRLARLQSALQKIERTIQLMRGQLADLTPEMLVIHDRGRTQLVPLADVIYLKAELKYITVRTATKHYILDGALSELEEKYKSQFMRIHRNALVARRAVRALEKYVDPTEGEGWAVRLQGIDERLFVSRRQVAAVREAITS